MICYHFVLLILNYQEILKLLFWGTKLLFIVLSIWSYLFKFCNKEPWVAFVLIIILLISLGLTFVFKSASLGASLLYSALFLFFGFYELFSFFTFAIAFLSVFDSFFTFWAGFSKFWIIIDFENCTSFSIKYAIILLLIRIIFNVCFCHP